MLFDLSGNINLAVMTFILDLYDVTSQETRRTSEMIPTPNLSHLTAKDYDHVYEPAGSSFKIRLKCWFNNMDVLTEDTFILLDALEEDAKELQALKPSVCLEIG